MSVEVGTTKARVPKALKEQNGTFNVTRDNKDAPTSASVLPPPPEHLTAHQQWAWAKFAKVIRKMRITTDEDFSSLEMLAKLYAQWTTLDIELNEHTTLTYEEETKFGTIQKLRPQLAGMRRIEPQLIALLGRFGLTPADRSRVSVIREGGEGNTDPEDEFGSN